MDVSSILSKALEAKQLHWGWFVSGLGLVLGAWLTQGYFSPLAAAILVAGSFGLLGIVRHREAWLARDAVPYDRWMVTGWETVWWLVAMGEAGHLPWATSPQGTLLAVLIAVWLGAWTRWGGPTLARPAVSQALQAAYCVGAIGWVAGWLCISRFAPAVGTLDGRITLGFGEADVTAIAFLAVWWVAVEWAFRPQRFPVLPAIVLTLSSLVLVGTTSRAVWLLWLIGLGWGIWRYRAHPAWPGIMAWTGVGMGSGLLWLHVPASHDGLWGLPLGIALGYRYRLKMPRIAAAWVVRVSLFVAAGTLAFMVPHLSHLLHAGSPLGSRWIMWTTAWRIFWSHPWGLGAHTFRNLYGRFEPYGFISEYPHNLALTWLDDLGLWAILPESLLMVLGYRWARAAWQGTWIAGLPLVLGIHTLLDVDAAFPFFLVLWTLAILWTAAAVPGSRTPPVASVARGESAWRWGVAMAGTVVAVWMALALLLGQLGLQLTTRHAESIGTSWLDIAHRVDPWSNSVAFYDSEARWRTQRPWRFMFQESLRDERQHATFLASATVLLATAHQYRWAEDLAQDVVTLTPWQASGYQLLSQVALTQSVLDPVGSSAAQQQARVADVTARRFFQRVAQEPSDVLVRNQTRTIDQPIALNGFLGATLAQAPQQALAWAPLLPRTSVVQNLLLANRRAKTGRIPIDVQTIADLVRLLRKSLKG